MRAVLTYLDRTDPSAAARARARYACFDHFGDDASRYGLLAKLGAAPSCEDEVVEQLLELRQAGVRSDRDGDEAFFAEQNARLVKNAEAYYRGMFSREVSTWNLRDRHMAETLDALVGHLAHDSRAKIAIWAHNSHLGDARATDMGMRGELNLGQLVRERHPDDCVLVGFTTHAGTVTAASDWDAPAERKRVRPSLAGSVEALFHATGLERFLLMLAPDDPATSQLREPMLERAIGVVYRPETERQSHYFHTVLPDQFDVVLHFDETRAVEPLERTAEWKPLDPHTPGGGAIRALGRPGGADGEEGEIPETFPFGV
jgi:erythromycin esterase-like protein